MYVQVPNSYILKCTLFYILLKYIMMDYNDVDLLHLAFYIDTVNSIFLSS